MGCTFPPSLMRVSFFTKTALTLGLLAQAVPALASPSAFTAKEFSDVPTSSTHYDAIEYLRQQNIVKGYEDGTFKPNELINRAEFAQLFTNPFFLTGSRVNDCVKKETSTGSSIVFFPDVKKTAWYADAICAAKVSSLINGYADGYYRPEQRIIVAEAAKIAARVFAIDVRRDEAGDPKWYTIYIKELGGSRNAIPSSIHSITQEMTRGEMAEMLYRLKTQKTDGAATSWQALLN